MSCQELGCGDIVEFWNVEHHVPVATSIVTCYFEHSSHSPLPSHCALQVSHGIACCHMLQSLALVLVFMSFVWCFMLTWFFSRSFIWRRQSRQENWRINTSRTFLPFKRYFSNVTVLQNMWKQSNSELQALNIYMTVYLRDSLWRWLRPTLLSWRWWEMFLVKYILTDGSWVH